MSTHANHDHPATPAARARCRRRNDATDAVRQLIVDDTSGITREFVRDLYAANRAQLAADEHARLTNINWADDHCSSCGETDLEYVMSRSYSGCCNKRVCASMPTDTNPCCPANARATNREYR